MKNMGSAFMRAKLPVLLYKFKNGTLDMNKDIERYFDEFIRNGGETGFTQLNTVEDYKRNIKRFVADAQGKRGIAKKSWDAVWDSFEFANRCAEDTSRFVTYITSRQSGRDIARSISDAKIDYLLLFDITNKKSDTDFEVCITFLFVITY